MRSATKIADLDLAFRGMVSEISRPKRVKWMFDDAATGKKINPLGRFPDVAEACLESGASFFHIARPLNVMLAHLRRRCVGKLPGDMKSALLSVKKECDEAEAMALTLAFCGEIPSASALVTSIKEDSDAILALERAKEIEEDKLAELEAR